MTAPIICVQKNGPLWQNQNNTPSEFCTFLYFSLYFVCCFLVYLIYFENRFYQLLTKFGKSWIFLGWLQMSYLLIFETGHFDCITSFLCFHLLLVYFISAKLVWFSVFCSGRAGSVCMFYFYVLVCLDTSFADLETGFSGATQVAEAATRGVLCKKVFLEISQNSQRNSCARASFLINLQASGL